MVFDKYNKSINPALLSFCTTICENKSTFCIVQNVKRSSLAYQCRLEQVVARSILTIAPSSAPPWRLPHTPGLRLVERRPSKKQNESNQVFSFVRKTWQLSASACLSFPSDKLQHKLQTDSQNFLLSPPSISAATGCFRTRSLANFCGF